MGFFRRTETRSDDNDRTRRLLDAGDTAFETEDSDFAEVVMEGLWSDVTTDPYPAAGHNYPRRD
ncbi:MAG: hypothetical protein HOY79_07475 [Streptomyces sp.]|nr:hypothetical protein [Streptomyces sp.]NUS13353.1 hypothetical protein [Streptomyces sp.]